MDINAAVEAGVIGGVKGLTGAGVVVGLLHQFHKGFRKNVGPSGKVALIISACFFKVALDSEHEIHRQQRSRWIDTVDAAAERRGEVNAAMRKLQEQKVRDSAK